MNWRSFNEDTTLKLCFNCKQRGIGSYVISADKYHMAHYCKKCIEKLQLIESGRVLPKTQY